MLEGNGASIARPRQIEGGRCAELLEYEARTNAQLPRRLDRATEVIQLRVNCENLVVTYVKRLLVDPAVMAPSWRDRKQRQHTQLHCNRQGLASQSGWTAMDILYGPDYAPLAEFTTRPSDCRES